MNQENKESLAGTSYELKLLLGAQFEEDVTENRSPSPSTHSWPLVHPHRNVRSCIEFATTPTNSAQIIESFTMDNIADHTHRNISNPFLLDLNMINTDERFDEDDYERRTISTSNSISMFSNEDVEDDDDTLSSTGTLSEVFESLSRFSEACLASVEALCSPQENETVTTPRANYPTCSAMANNLSSQLEITMGERFGSAKCSNSADNLDSALPQSDTGETYFPVESFSLQRRTSTKEQKTWDDYKNDIGTDAGVPNTHILESSNTCTNHLPTRSNNIHRLGSKIGQNSGCNNTMVEAGSIGQFGILNCSILREKTDESPALHTEENSILSLLGFEESYQTYVRAAEWQDRCMELEVTLQRFGEQATHVRSVLREKLAEYERRVVDAESRASIAEGKLRVMEQQLSEATSSCNSGSWGAVVDDVDKLCSLESAVREKERVISRLECQVEEQRLLRLQESRQVEEKAAKIKEWVSNKLRDLEDQNEHLREQNQKCETQLELLRSRLTQLSQLSSVSSAKSKDRHSTEDSSRGSYEGDRLPSDESPPPDSGDNRINNPQVPTPRPLSATQACLAAIRRRSGAFDTPEERRQRRKANTSTGSNSGIPGSLTQERISRDSRSSRVDSGSVDMETPVSLSPRSPLNALETLDPTLPDTSSVARSSNSSSSSVGGVFGGQQGSSIHSHLAYGPNNNNNNNVINISSPLDIHPVPNPVPITIPDPIPLCISHSPLPVTPVDVVMVGGAESTQSLSNEPTVRRLPIVPPRKCRTRSPTPNTSIGTTPGSGECSPPTQSEEDATLLRAKLDAECQQLARDLQAAVQELVRPELNLATNDKIPGVKGTSFNNIRAKALDENNDYSEIYTPSADEKLNFNLGQPPPPPIHRFPSWESRIYEVAAGGLKIPSSSANEESSGGMTRFRHRSYHSLGINFSIPVYTTVKGRASQIRSTPFSGDTSDSSDGEDIGSGSGSGPSHPISSGETDLSSPGKSVASSIANSVSPIHRSSSSPSKTSIRREASFESEISDDYAIPPDAFASETSSLDIALSTGCRNLTPNVSQMPSVSPSNISTTHPGDSPRKDCLEKSGFLTKLGGKFKTWRKRWFVLKNGTLTYWKSPQDINRRSSGRDISLDENCSINRGDGASTFEIVTSNKTYYLSADSTIAVDDWVRVLQNVVRRNATKLVLSMEDSKPTIQGLLVKVKNGHARRCWCVLIGKMFLTFKSPSDQVASGQINMRDARVEDVDHVSDSDNDEKDEDSLLSPDALTIGIFPSHQSPIYLHLPTKQEKDTWLYHLTIVSGKGPSAGTQFEQLVHKLMEIDGDPTSTLWKNPLLLHSKESITSPLTSLSSEILQTEAIKLFKSCQLFMSVPLDSAGIDYHVALAQNALQLCLDYPELQTELICALVKQTSRTLSYKSSPHNNRALNKIKHSRHFLLNATQSLFLCDSSSGHSKLNQTNHNGSNNHYLAASSNKSSSTLRTNNHTMNHVPTPASPPRTVRSGGSSRTSPAKQSKGSSSVPSSPLLNQNHGILHHHSLSKAESKSAVRSFVFLQGWQLLSLAISLFLPKNSILLWYLKQHLLRNVDIKSDCGKYAAYCQRSIERSLINGPRNFKPSRMEVLSILIKNPFHHSHPHSVPVHFLTGGYQVVDFDGSTTVQEFLLSLCHSIVCRNPEQSGFSLFVDDPFEKDIEHSLLSCEKICDVISQWETILREKGSGKFETRRAATLSFKSRIYKKSGILQETDKEKLLLCYQTNRAVVVGKFPLTKELALELAALMAQIDGGDYKVDKGRGSRGSQLVLQALEKYYPTRYRDNLSTEKYKALCDNLLERWTLLKGKSTLDCVRIYLTCTRKWQFFGANLFSVNVQGTHTMENGTNVWAAISEDGISILDIQNLQQIGRYSYGSIQTFGGAQDDSFMFVVDDYGKKRRILFGGMSRLKVLEMTRLVADYINACSNNGICGTNKRITRHSSLKSSSRLQSMTTLPPATPKLDRKFPNGELKSSSKSPNPVQRCDSLQAHRSPRP